MGETVSSTLPIDAPTVPVKKSKSPAKSPTKAPAKAPTRRKATTVSACTAPAKKRPGRKARVVNYDSDEGESEQTDVDLDSQPIQPSTSKRTRKIRYLSYIVGFLT